MNTEYVFDFLVYRTYCFSNLTYDQDKFMKLFQENQVIVLVGETGSGKTTQIPQFALEAIAQQTPSVRIP